MAFDLDTIYNNHLLDIYGTPFSFNQLLNSFRKKDIDGIVKIPRFSDLEFPEKQLLKDIKIALNKNIDPNLNNDEIEKAIVENLISLIDKDLQPEDKNLQVDSYISNMLKMAIIINNMEN